MAQIDRGTVRQVASSARRSLNHLLGGTSRAATVQDADAPVATSCHAPFSTIFFDTLGVARPCCRNTRFPLGQVADRSIREIWDGWETAQLRRALREGDHSYGCQWCSTHAQEGDAEHVYARLFDRYGPSVAEPRWPKRMEFSLSNTCNLACEMCNGELSSTIRRRREKLEPLVNHYGESFFDELVEFLPHLETAGFAGGEPFLARESMRVFGLLMEHAPHVRCNVATNGTIWSSRVEHILDELVVDVAVSIDSARPDTFERIRVGASFDTVIENLDRFVERARRRGTTVEIHHCLMPRNVDELSEILRLAEERDILVAINAVREPKELSLDYLDREPLARAAESLETQLAEWGERLPRNGAVLRQEADRLRRRLDAMDAGESFPELYDASEMFMGLPRRSRGSADAEDGRRRLDASWSGEPYRLVMDADEVLVDVDERTATRLRTTREALIGQPGEAVIPLVITQFGDIRGEETVFESANLVEREVTYAKGRVRAVMGVERDDEGRATSGSVWFTDLLPASDERDEGAT